MVAPSTALTWPQVLAWRLRRGGVAPPLDLAEEQVARRLCGVQAQVPSAAALAVAVRRTTGRADLPAALRAGRLVRTWSVRGTLHVLPPATAARQLSLLADARTWHRGTWQRSFLPLPVVTALAEHVARALAAGPLTRDELIGAVAEDVGPDVVEQLQSGWSAVLKPLAWTGVLCNGPPRGGRVTFARPDLLLPEWPGLPDADDAGPVVVREYLAVYGPSTPAAFDAWLLRGVTPKAALRRWFAALADETVEVDVEGRHLLARRDDLPELRETPPATAVHLLPAFDQYVLGPGTTDPAVVPAAHRARVSRPGGWISPVVVAGGRVVGTWEPVDGAPVVELFPDADVPGSALGAAVERMTDLLSAATAD